jgi:hypothetical protein
MASPCGIPRCAFGLGGTEGFTGEVVNGFITKLIPCWHFAPISNQLGDEVVYWPLALGHAMDRAEAAKCLQIFYAMGCLRPCPHCLECSFDFLPDSPSKVLTEGRMVNGCTLL